MRHRCQVEEGMWPFRDMHARLPLIAYQWIFP